MRKSILLSIVSWHVAMTTTTKSVSISSMVSADAVTTIKYSNQQRWKNVVSAESQPIEILQNYINEMTPSFWERSQPDFVMVVIGMILFLVGSTYTYRSHRRLREYNFVHSELSKLDRDRALALLMGKHPFKLFLARRNARLRQMQVHHPRFITPLLVHRWIHDNNSSGNQYNPLAQDFHDEYFGSDDPSKK